jgi:DNA invertase Pin-like site-specific DNA recombinase
MKEHNNKLAGAGESPKIRCAAYTRYSSDMQSSTSSEDQLRNCHALANEKGWGVLDEYVRSDEELTGRTLVGREGLADLLRLAQQRPRPFDCILIDDTSRLGRDLPDVLKVCDMFMHYGVFIYFVSDRLDSRDESFRIVHLVKGYGDERYSKDLGKKIHRGQEGKIRKGYTSGASCYGYKNTYIRDSNQKGIHGDDKVVAVKQQIVSEHAEIIVRIMEMRASGLSFARIAKILKAEGVPAPQRKYKGKILNYWLPSTIKQITNNELYRGVRHWNRTQKVLNPANGKKNKRVRQQSEWVRVPVPDLRIVSDELWERVQQVNQQMKDKLYGRRLGGLNRTAQSRTYLFSNIMNCGLCGGKFSVIIGGEASKVRYGCKNQRFRDTCSNRFTIKWQPLEQQLIAAISKNLLDPRLEQQRIRDFSAQLQARIELEEKLASDSVSNAPKLIAERADLENQAGRIADAIGQHGYSPVLSAQLSKVESRMAQIDRLLAAKPALKLPKFTDDEIREFLRQESKDFCDALTGDPEFARLEIQKRIKKLVLTPKETPDGAVLEVYGDVALLRTGDVLVESPIQRTSQQYIGVSTPLAGIILNPAPLLAPRQPQ